MFPLHKMNDNTASRQDELVIQRIINATTEIQRMVYNSVVTREEYRRTNRIYRDTWADWEILFR